MRIKGRKETGRRRGGRGSETGRGVFRGPALAGWHLTICQNSPRALPSHRATMRRVTELRASADDGRVPHPLLPPPLFPRRQRRGPHRPRAARRCANAGERCRRRPSAAESGREPRRPDYERVARAFRSRLVRRVCFISAPC